MTEPVSASAIDSADVVQAPGYRGRFAPSPTGHLHAGSLVAALGSWLMARAAGGEWWVRIEDLDPPREVPGAARQQLATLTSFGLVPDGPIVFQSERHGLYRRALERLLDEGKAFHCHCSRAELAQCGGVHRRCIARARRRDPSVRLRVGDDAVVAFTDALQGEQIQNVATAVGDFVLRRADGYWAYQLAVVVDDADQGITHVVRGCDLLDSTARQIVLQRALGVATPAYAHLPLVTDHAGRKLSKSEGDGAVDPDNPLAALTHAWELLRQARQSLPVARSPAAWLQAAQQSFDASRLTDVRKTAPPIATNSSRS